MPAGEMWSVVTESPSSASTRAPRMSRGRHRLERHAVEVRRPLDVRRTASSHSNSSPCGMSRSRQSSSPSKTSRYFSLEHLGLHGVAHRRFDLGLRRPDVAQVHRRAVLADPERLAVQIDVHRAGERVGDHQRRRREVVRLAPPAGCGPRSCGCPRAPTPRRGSLRGSRSRCAPAAGRSCRCRSCSRSRRDRSRALRGTCVSPASSR